MNNPQKPLKNKTRKKVFFDHPIRNVVDNEVTDKGLEYILGRIMKVDSAIVHEDILFYLTFIAGSSKTYSSNPCRYRGRGDLTQKKIETLKDHFLVCHSENIEYRDVFLYVEGK